MRHISALRSTHGIPGQPTALKLKTGSIVLLGPALDHVDRHQIGVWTGIRLSDRSLARQPPENQQLDASSQLEDRILGRGRDQAHDGLLWDCLARHVVPGY